MNTLERTLAFLIGDGSVFYTVRRKDGSTIGNCVFDMHHGPEQERYMLWKKEYMTSLGFSGSFNKRPVTYRSYRKDKYEGKTYVSCQVRMRSHIIFTKLRAMAYPNNVKTYTSDWINPETVDSFALAVWWMDDGGVHVTGKYKNHVSGQLYSCTNEEETILIKDLWEKKINSELTIQKRRNTFILYFPTPALINLLKIIYPYIHEDMLYKTAFKTGEDGKPITPTSTDNLKKMLFEIMI
jgi:hypothetical protein